MGLRGIQLLLALLIAIPRFAWAGPPVASGDIPRHEILDAAARSGPRPVDHSGKSLDTELREAFNSFNASLDTTDEAAVKRVYKDIFDVLLTPERGFIGRVPAVSEDRLLGQFFGETLQLENMKGTGAAAQLRATHLSAYFAQRRKEVIDELTAATLPNQVKEQDAFNAAVKLVSIANLMGDPDLRNVQFRKIVNGKPEYDTEKIAEYASKVLEFVNKKYASTPGTKGDDLAKIAAVKTAIAQALVHVKGMINLSQGIDPSDPRRKFPNGNQLAGNNPFQNGKPGGGQDGGKDEGNSGGGKGGGGGGNGGGGGGGQRSQIPQLQPPEIAKINDLIDKNFAQKITQDRANEFNLVNSQNGGPQRGAPLDSSAVGALVQDFNNYGQQLSATIAGMYPFLKGGIAGPVIGPMLQAVTNRVRQVASEPRPISGASALGANLGFGLGGGTMYKAGLEVSPNGTPINNSFVSSGMSGGTGSFTAAAAASRNRGAEQPVPGSNATANNGLHPKYVGQQGVDNYVATHAGAQVHTSHGVVHSATTTHTY